MITPEEVNARIALHEAVCAERYGHIREDLGELKDASWQRHADNQADIAGIKKLLYWLLSGMATTLITVLGYLLIHFVVK